MKLRSISSSSYQSLVFLFFFFWSFGPSLLFDMVWCQLLAEEKWPFVPDFGEIESARCLESGLDVCPHGTDTDSLSCLPYFEPCVRLDWIICNVHQFPFAYFPLDEREISWYEERETLLEDIEFHDLQLFLYPSGSGQPRVWKFMELSNMIHMRCWPAGEQLQFLHSDSYPRMRSQLMPEEWYCVDLRNIGEHNVYRHFTRSIYEEHLRQFLDLRFKQRRCRYLLEPHDCRYVRDVYYGAVSRFYDNPSFSVLIVRDIDNRRVNLYLPSRFTPVR